MRRAYTKYDAVKKTRICSRCNTEKCALDFSQNKTSPDGLSSQCKACDRERHSANNSELKWEKHLWYKFWMRPFEYYLKLKEQDGVCAVCHKLCQTGKRLGVDHNHDTHVNRGLLCQNCNVMLGVAQEDILILESAINYLKKWSNA